MEIGAIEDRPHPGRPSQFDKTLMEEFQCLIRKLGYSLKRLIYSHLQASQRRVKEFRKEFKKLQEAIKGIDELIIFEDETGFSLHPKLGRVEFTRSCVTKMKWIIEGFLKNTKRIAVKFKDKSIDRQCPLV